jgi:hypothetical protein
MNWRFIKHTISGIILFVLVDGCVQPADKKSAKAELTKGIRNDSLLLGIRFGDTQKEFREKCLALNKKHLTTEGPGYAVRYLVYDSLVHRSPTSIQLLFVPGFDEKELLTDMDLKFSYLGWAPWNRRFQSDSLENKVIDLLMHWYGGNRFVTVHTEDGPVPVKVDGNRRMLMYEDAPQNVIVRIQDMSRSRDGQPVK